MRAIALCLSSLSALTSFGRTQEEGQGLAPLFGSGCCAEVQIVCQIREKLSNCSDVGEREDF